MESLITIILKIQELLETEAEASDTAQLEEKLASSQDSISEATLLPHFKVI
jgi:hypothetical protein